jgi:hypothetical protein
MPDGGTAGLGWLALETFGRSALGSEPPQTCPHPAFPQILHFGASMSNSLSNVSNSFLFCFVAEARDGACTVTFHLAYWDPAVPIRPLSARPHFGPIPALKIKGVEWLLCELWLTYAVSSVPHTAIRAYSSSYSGLAAVWTRSKPHLQPTSGIGGRGQNWPIHWPRERCAYFHASSISSGLCSVISTDMYNECCGSVDHCAASRCSHSSLGHAPCLNCGGVTPFAGLGFCDLIPATCLQSLPLAISPTVVRVTPISSAIASCFSPAAALVLISIALAGLSFLAMRPQAGQWFMCIPARCSTL